MEAMEEPSVKPIGDSIFVTYHGRAILEFARFSESRDTCSAEVTISTWEGTELHWARVNLASTQGRSALSKAVEEAEPAGDWRPMLERACRVVAKHLRVGEPAVPLIAAPLSTASPRWWIDGWMPERQLSVLFADGGTGKSYLALALVLAGLFARPLSPRWRVGRVQRALYLDWESDREEQQYRLWRLCAGLGSEPVDRAILHRTMRRPLREEIGAVRAEVAREAVDCVIADSLAPACGPEPESADAAVTTLLALRSLAVTTLCLAHVSKVAADSKGPARPFGSVHIQNLARSVIEARSSELDTQEESILSLYHRKSNHGRRCIPSALRFTWDPSGAIRITGAAPEFGGATLAFQILEALKPGPKETVALAEELDASAATIRSTMTRLENRGMVLRLVGSQGGRGQNTQWGLIDTNRGINRGNADDSATVSDDEVLF